MKTNPIQPTLNEQMMPWLTGLLDRPSILQGELEATAIEIISLVTKHLLALPEMQKETVNVPSSMPLTAVANVEAMVNYRNSKLSQIRAAIEGVKG